MQVLFCQKAMEGFPHATAATKSSFINLRPPTPMKNILFITMDQLRHDALGFRNVFPVRTPHIDALAEQGAVFENAYCPSPICVASRASIMTGMPPCDTGVYYNDGAWDDALPTLPGELSKNGYFNIGVGKMHFRPKRRYAGFDKRNADNDTDYPLYLARHGVQPDGDEPGEEAMKHRSFATRPTAVPYEHYLPVYITDTALQELGLIHSRRDCRPGANEPFFMWLSYLLPHTPCTPPEPWFSMYSPEDFLPFVRDEKEVAAFSPEVKEWYDNWRFIDDGWAAKLRAQYMGCVSLVDAQIGRVVSRLKELGLWENTLVVFSSDHGDYMGDHFMQQKAFFHDCSAKVPLVACGPGVPAGAVVRENVSLIDLMPTLMDYCELQPARFDDTTRTRIVLDEVPSDGASLLDAFRPQGLDADRAVASETGIHGLGVMVRWRNLKAVHYDISGRLDFFDLGEDPGELDNRGPGMSLGDLPEPMRERLEDVRSRADRFRGRKYYCKGKVRPMFT